MTTSFASNKTEAAVLGQLIGDAAALGTHWIYDVDELHARYDGKIEGFETPLPGHYHEGRKSGESTHYGDATRCLQKSITENGGTYSSQAFGATFVETFGSPDYRGYKDHATKDTLENINAFVAKHPNAKIPYETLGSSDDQMASVASLGPLLPVSESLDTLAKNVTSFTRIRQNNPKAVSYAKFVAHFAYFLTKGNHPKAALTQALELSQPSNPNAAEIVAGIEKAKSLLDKEVVHATAALGQSCPLSSSVPAAVHAFLKNSHDYEKAILETIRAGGDNAGRAAIVGLLSGAYLGMDGIPAAWQAKLA